MPSDVPPTLGGILAGGLARRMGGGDKGLRGIGGHSVLARLIERVAPQVSRLVLNANDDPARFAQFGLPVVPDSLPDHPGPLAGVLAVMEWAAETEPEAGWIVTLPADAPFLPPDLVARLHGERKCAGAMLACAASGRRTHPVIGVWPVAMRAELRRAVAEEGLRKIDRFTARYPTVAVEWAVAPVDPFFNVNTPEDLAEAERIAAGACYQSSSYGR